MNPFLILCDVPNIQCTLPGTNRETRLDNMQKRSANRIPWNNARVDTLQHHHHLDRTRTSLQPSLVNHQHLPHIHHIHLRPAQPPAISIASRFLQNSTLSSHTSSSGQPRWTSRRPERTRQRRRRYGYTEAIHTRIGLELIGSIDIKCSPRVKLTPFYSEILNNIVCKLFSSNLELSPQFLRMAKLEGCHHKYVDLS